MRKTRLDPQKVQTWLVRILADRMIMGSDSQLANGLANKIASLMIVT